MAGMGLFGGRAVAAGSTSAAAAGFHYPDEAVAHERTFMQWPVSQEVYGRDGTLAQVQRTIARVANTIAEFEPVVMLMAKSHQAAARKQLGQAVEIWDIPTDDLWARDSGPAFVIDGKGGLAMTQFNFNGWGNKQPHPNDGKIAARVAERLGLQLFDAGVVGEAGGVETDGQGTLIAHASSWINPNRNRGGRAQVERKLLDTMGAQKMIWAPGVKGADITDYHIDALARFVRPGEVLIQIGEELDPNDPWSVSAAETYDILEAATDAKGRKLKLVEIPEPYDIRVLEPDFVASYVNYYVCNGAVISSNFGDRDTDAEAVDIFRRLYPGREVVSLNTDWLGRIGGGIHCATHEQPKV